MAKGMAYTEAWNGNESAVFGGRKMLGGDVLVEKCQIRYDFQWLIERVWSLEFVQYITGNY